MEQFIEVTFCGEKILLNVKNICCIQKGEGNSARIILLVSLEDLDYIVVSESYEEIKEKIKGVYKMKFKFGDKVRLKKNLKLNKQYGSFRFGEPHAVYRDKELKVERIFTESEYYWLCDPEDHICVSAFGLPIGFTDEMLEPASSCTEKIVVISDGVKVFARYFKDGTVQEETVATCAVNDAFDFFTGAETACKRMFRSNKRKKELKGIGESIALGLAEGFVASPNSTAELHPNCRCSFNLGEFLKDVPFSKYLECANSKYYNGSVVCVDNKDCEMFYTKGKIYNFKDGILTDKGKQILRHASPVESFEEWCKSSVAKWLEIKE